MDGELRRFGVSIFDTTELGADNFRVMKFDHVSLILEI
jgi:hypothetical protein